MGSSVHLHLTLHGTCHNTVFRATACRIAIYSLKLAQDKLPSRLGCQQLGPPASCHLMLIQPKMTAVYHTVDLLRLPRSPNNPLCRCDRWGPHTPPTFPESPDISIIVTCQDCFVFTCLPVFIFKHHLRRFLRLVSSVNLVCEPSVISSQARWRTEPFGIPLETLFLLEIGQCVGLHLYEGPRRSKLFVMESRMVGARGWVWGCLGAKFLLVMMKKFWVEIDNGSDYTIS